MKRITTGVLSLFLLGLGFISAKDSLNCSQLSSDALMRCMDQWVRDEALALGIPDVAAAVIKNGTVFYTVGYKDGQAINNTNTPFILNSLSKSITATAIMQLVEAGKLDLDAPISQYIDFVPVDKASISLRQLLNQNSGFGTPSGTLLIYGQEQGETALELGVRQLLTLPLASQPGSRFEYSNSNYILLGYLIEVVSSKSYETYVQDHIFTPLSMTTARGLFPGGLSGIVQGHADMLGRTIAYEMPYARAYTPAGYIVASVDDLVRFVQAHLNGGEFNTNRILSAAGIAILHQAGVKIDDQIAYAMGWFVKTRYGKTVLRHNGTGPAFHSLMMVEPESKTGVIILMNKNNLTQTQRYDHLGEGLYALAVGQPIPPLAQEDLIDQVALPTAVVLFALQVILFAGLAYILRNPRSSLLKRWGIAVWVVNLISFIIYIIYLPTTVTESYEYLLREMPGNSLFIVGILLMGMINAVVYGAGFYFSRHQQVPALH